jgi:hypothetical protein
MPVAHATSGGTRLHTDQRHHSSSSAPTRDGVRGLLHVRYAYLKRSYFHIESSKSLQGDVRHGKEGGGGGRGLVAQGREGGVGGRGGGSNLMKYLISHQNLRN